MGNYPTWLVVRQYDIIPGHSPSHPTRFRRAGDRIEDAPEGRCPRGNLSGFKTTGQGRMNAFCLRETSDASEEVSLATRGKLLRYKL